MFDADRPIQKTEQDRLGRAVFAKYLARCILDHDSAESLVVGLYGGWGSGKTSIINLTLEELNSAASNMVDAEKPVILNFSPWSYSGQNQLIFAFFRRLSSVLRQAPNFENRDRIIHLLELYVSFFTHKPIPRTLRKDKNFFARMLHPLIAREDLYGWESGRDLTQVKAELNDLLKQQKHKIIIFIDNISRLEDVEIKQVFQIVKSMGDYVNSTYVLAMDKALVTQALDNIQGGGADYLEKVVQLPFEIPAISQQDLESILFAKLKALIQLIPASAWNNDYWADIYYSTLKYFFADCRDITHYVNTLNFSFVRVKDIVNPVDFFAITAIYVSSPQVYYGIRDNKDLFTDLVENVYEFDAEKLAEDKLRCDEILNRAGDIPHETLQQLLIRLFPRLRSVYQTTLTFYHSEAIARKNHRICDPDVFDVYFRLSIPAGYISDAELKAILTLTHDEEGFALALWRLNQDDRATKFLSLLDGIAIQKIPKENVGNVICAILDNADLLPDGESNNLSFSTPMRIHRIFHQLLNRFDTSDERFAIFHEAIKKTTKSLYIMTHELDLQSQQHIEDEDTFVPVEHRDFTPEQLKNLQKLTVAKIRYWAEIKRLQEHPKLIPILYAWKAWGDASECQQYVGSMAQDDVGLLALLCAVLQEPINQTMTKLAMSPTWESYLNQIEDFVSINILEPHAKMLFEDESFEKLREREQLALLIFLDLVKAKTVKIIPQTG